MGIVSRSGGGGGGLGSLAFDSTLGADAAIIDSGAIVVQTGTVLIARWKARTDEAVAVSSINVRVNGSSGAIYDRVFVSGANATAAANNQLAGNGWNILCSGNTGTAGVFGDGELELFRYAGTANPKTGGIRNGVMDQTAANTNSQIYQVGFRSASAINQVSIAPGGGTVLRAGSSLAVYVF